MDSDFDFECNVNQLRGEISKKVKSSKIDSKLHDVDLDSEAGEIFEIVDAGQGDEFMAVLPWKGAIKEPENHPDPNPEAPSVDYLLEFVYGYRVD
jgi:microtubule-associated protein-like 6